MTANEFHTECLNGFLTVSKSFGYGFGGPLGNEVLAKRAEQSVRELLKFKPLIKMFGEDPTMYYYYINGLAFAMGIVLAMLQANAPQKFAERGLIEMIVNDPETSAHDLAFHTMQQFGMAPEIYNQFVQELYKKFQELHEPYWKVKEPRDYTLAAFYASFMTGCSIAIDCFQRKRAEKAMAVKPAPAAEEQPAADKKPAKAKKPTAKKATSSTKSAKKPRASAKK